MMLIPSQVKRSVLDSVHFHSVTYVRDTLLVEGVALARTASVAIGQRSILNAEERASGGGGSFLG